MGGVVFLLAYPESLTTDDVDFNMGTGFLNKGMQFRNWDVCKLDFENKKLTATK